MDFTIIANAYSLEESLELSPQDAIVLASVFKHLEESGDEPGCFLNRNARDFDDPDIVKRLGENNCKLFGSLTNDETSYGCRDLMTALDNIYEMY